MLIKDITKKELPDGHIGNMLIIEMAKIELIKRPYWNYANYRDGQIELTGGHIEIMLIKDITNKELTDGHIGNMLIIEMAKIELNKRQYWN